MRSIRTVAAFAAFSRGVEGYWRMSCSIIQTGRVDPVINFGTVSSHVHKISGAANININSTYASLQQSECTSCSIQADKSAYWTPQLYYQHASGQYEEVPNSGMAIYYLGRGIGADGSGAIPFPEGLQMLSGNAFARSYDNSTMTWGNKTYPSRPVADRVSFVCIDYNNAIPQTTGMLNTTCPDGMRAQIHMQSCWDGKRLSSTDQSHVAYLSQIDNGACPPTHPYLLPHLFYEVMYSVTEFSPVKDGGKYVFANGDASGYGFHGDFFNGWDTPTLQAGINTCLQGTGTGPGTPGDGAVGDCPAFKATNNDNFASLCPEHSPVFPCETVHGVIGTSLPGCITPTGFGPASNAALTTCPGGNSAACLANYKTTGPLVVSGNADYKSIGCFTEATGGRALTAKSYSNATNMVEQCLAFCSGYTYAAVEWGVECYCGQKLNTGSIQANASDCDMSCSANQWEICGGRSRLNVYLLKNIASSSISSTTTTTTKLSSTTSTVSSALTSSAIKTSSSLIRTSSSSTMKTSTLITLVGAANAVYSQSTSATSTTSAAASPTGPAIVPGNANFAYFGCVNEPSGGRAFPTQLTITSAKTVENCLAAAATYQWVGLEYGGECWAGMALDQTTATNASASSCKMTCSGNTKEICGGPSLLTLYQRIVPTTQEFIGDNAKGFSYYGCVQEPSSGRLLDNKLAANSSMTVDMCMSLVAAANNIQGAGYQYVGVEYGKECWAGIKNQSAIVMDGAGGNGCNMPCAGDATQWCGGSSRLNLYTRMQG